MDFDAYLSFFITVVVFVLSISLIIGIFVYFDFKYWSTEIRPKAYCYIFIISFCIIAFFALPFILL